MNNIIKIGTIISTHGLKGQVKIFAEINQFEKLIKSNKIHYKNGNILEITGCKVTNKDNVYIVAIKNCNKIEEVETLIKSELFTNKDNLSEKDEILVSDLIGLNVYKKIDGEQILIGTVHEIVNYGRGSMFEIVGDADGQKIAQLYPATFDFIENINLIEKYLVLKDYTVSMIVE